MTIRSVLYDEYLTTTTYSAGTELTLANATGAIVTETYHGFISGFTYCASGVESYVYMLNPNVTAGSNIGLNIQTPISRVGVESFVGALGIALDLSGDNGEVYFALAGV